MRTKPLLGERAWFGPRWLGWGWTPVSREGWASLALALVLAIAVKVVFDGGASDLATLLIAGALVATCIVKGTPPGGPIARHKFREARGTETDSAG